MKGRLFAVPAFLLLAVQALAQEPTGLAASALANPSFAWQRDSIPGFRVYTIPGSYSHAHRDSLARSLPTALAHAQRLIAAPHWTGVIDVFYVDDRSQMEAITGAPVTGFAHVLAKAVFLVTNRDWRAFERHEIMHVVAGNTWGHDPRRNAWLIEGLGQAADGSCAGYPNEAMAVALAQRDGWIALDTMLRRFREQSDLRAYLQSASFTRYLLDHAGIPAVRTLWQAEADTSTMVRGERLAVWERRWRAGLAASPVPDEVAANVQAIGCGIGAPQRPPNLPSMLGGKDH